MKVILAHMPALDAAIIRFDAWWSGLSVRERVLVGVFGALLAITVVVFGIVKPLQAARADALADIRTYETLNARIRAAGTLGAAPAPRRQGPPEQIAMTAANSFGLTATSQPIPGGVRMTVADASYDALIGWIADLAATSDLRVRRLSVQRGAAPGRVSASLDLRP